MKILYILMRTDMLSMNPGKAIAQGSHATSQFHRFMENTPEMEAAKNGGVADGVAAEYLEWLGQSADNAWTYGGEFGTVLTLGCTEAEMREVINYANKYEMVCGIVTDPTYPLRDGATTHFFPVDTCAWVFADKEIARGVLGWLELHP